MRFRQLTAICLVAGLIGAGVACSKESPPPPTALTGVITQIAAGAAGEVTGFDLEAGEKSYNILIDPGRDYGFDLNHLYEHERLGDPVRVRLRAEDETLYALRIDDA
jgi:hypothetical protein